MISLQKISAQAASRKTYLKGVSCYNSGLVRKVELLPDLQSDELRGEVLDQPQEGSGCYHVSVELDKAGNPLSYLCECSDFEEYEGACMHIVALMVHKYYGDMASYVTPASRLLEHSLSASQEERRTDSAARAMIDRYSGEQAAALTLSADPEESKVELVPTLYLDSIIADNAAALEFTLGVERQYVLKSLYKFYVAMEEGQTLEYGRQLSFYHHLDSFAQPPRSLSRPLAQLILDRCRELLSTPGERRYAAGQGYVSTALFGGRLDRTLALTPHALDRFFALYEGRTVSCKAGIKPARPMLLTRGDPQIPVKVGRSDQRRGFTLQAVCGSMAKGEDCLYLEQGDCLYRCSPDYSRRMEGFLRCIGGRRQELFIADADIAAFCSSVLPQIRPHILPEGKYDLLRSHEPSPLTARLYLDAPDSGTVTAQLCFCYPPAPAACAPGPLSGEGVSQEGQPPFPQEGEAFTRVGPVPSPEQAGQPADEGAGGQDSGGRPGQEPPLVSIPAFGEDRAEEAAGPVNRNTLEEMRVTLLVKRYFDLPGEQDAPGGDLREGMLVCREESRLYRLVTEGIGLLSRSAEIYATDRFRRIKALPAPMVSLGVSLTSGLLDISIDAGELDLNELAQVLDSYRSHKRYHRLRDGRFLLLDSASDSGAAPEEDGADGRTGGLEALSQLADGLDLTGKQLASGRLAVPQYRAAYLDGVLQASLREGGNLQASRDSHFQDLVRDLKGDSPLRQDFAIPKSMEKVLRGYQKAGFRWLRMLEHYGFGGILADDMGLGKTVQVIALLLDQLERGETQPSLVVCPSSVVLNWESELKRFAPALKPVLVVGGAEERAEILAGLGGTPGEVAVTSYELIRRDVELYKPIRFHYHILDEAQYIKNHNTQNARSVKAVASRHRLALTGTPIENRLSELWSIFDFLMPGFLYGYTHFREKLEAPIVKLEDKEALERLGKLTAPFILRRLKRDVLTELPPKNESVFYTEMSEEQRKLYLAVLAQAQQKLRERDTPFLGQNKLAVLAMLTKLRQICCDPGLCYAGYKGGSAKLDSCVELILEARDNGHKLLLFSQFTSMLAVLEERLLREGVSSFLLQGSTPREERAELVRRFNEDDTTVFLISLKAGGTGLNLTGADMVIHYDPWWNLAAQNQATDRAYRIGQHNSVQVYKLIAKSTIEEKILRLQETKQGLADSVIQEGDAVLASLSREELLELLE